MLDAQQREQRVREINEIRDEITKLAGQLNAANYRAKAAEELSREARQQLERAVTYSFDADGSLV